MNTNLNTDVYNADIYLSLSREDGDKEAVSYTHLDLYKRQEQFFLKFFFLQ